MKILDPQSAVLTNPEVLSFMRTHPPRKPDPPVGGYPVTDLRGLWEVRREFSDYTETITPHLLSYPDPPSKYMQTLLQRLHKFNLTKPEVLMMINLGVGVKELSDARQRTTEAHNEDEVETVENGDGDLLDKFERHLNSAVGTDGTLANGNTEPSTEDIRTQNEQEDSPDASVLSTIIEEMDERFSNKDVNEILRVCGEVLSGTEMEEIETGVEG